MAVDREVLLVALQRFEFALDQLEKARRILEAEADGIRSMLRGPPSTEGFEPAHYTQAIIEALQSKPIGGVSTLYLKPGAIDDDVSKR